MFITMGVVLGTATAIPAAASAAPASVAALETHCVVYVVDQLNDGELQMSRPTCFPTQREAAALAAQPALAPRAAGVDAGNGVALFTLGIHYDGYNGTGASITVVGSSCSGGWWNTPTWFDNKISSSFNGCYRLRHYNRPNRAGSSTSTTGVGDIDNLPYFMNNRTESVAYFSS